MFFPRSFFGLYNNFSTKTPPARLLCPLRFSPSSPEKSKVLQFANSQPFFFSFFFFFWSVQDANGCVSFCLFLRNNFVLPTPQRPFTIFKPSGLLPNLLLSDLSARQCFPGGGPLALFALSFFWHDLHFKFPFCGIPPSASVVQLCLFLPLTFFS